MEQCLPSAWSVYYVVSDTVCVGKIGVSENLKSRICSLRRQSPYMLHLAGWLECRSKVQMLSLEKWLLQQIPAGDRLRGEWFQVTPTSTQLLDVFSAARADDITAFMQVFNECAERERAYADAQRFMDRHDWDRFTAINDVRYLPSVKARALGREARPWYWCERQVWCVVAKGRRYVLGADGQDAKTRWAVLRRTLNI